MNKPLYLQAFERLPERFRKPNTKDLYYVLYNGSDELESAYQMIRDSQSIDKAFGQTLDLLGANVGEFRQEGMDDDLYRLYIKVRIISNLSIGDIPTINYVMSTLLGDKYLSIKEGFLDNEYLYNEPASLRMGVHNTTEFIPYDVLERIKAAGIRILIDEIFTTECKLQTQAGTANVKVWLCGEHSCGEIPYNYTVGQAELIAVKARTSRFDSENDYGLAGEGYRAGELRNDYNDRLYLVQDMSSDINIDFGGDI